MTSVTPAVISENFAEIKQKIEMVDGLTPWVHLDVMDGKFVVPTTWNSPVDLASLAGEVKIEVHLMVEKPEEVLVDWLPYADRLIVHLEATDLMPDIIEAFQNSKVELGVALELGTPLGKVWPYVPKVDLIQLMSIAEIGYHSHGFQNEVLERISTLRENFSDVKIQIDGGVNLETGEQSVKAGADVLVVGSTIWNSPDPKETIFQLQNLA